MNKCSPFFNISCLAFCRGIPPRLGSFSFPLHIASLPFRRQSEKCHSYAFRFVSMLFHSLSDQSIALHIHAVPLQIKANRFGSRLIFSFPLHYIEMHFLCNSNPLSAVHSHSLATPVVAMPLPVIAFNAVPMQIIAFPHLTPPSHLNAMPSIAYARHICTFPLRYCTVLILCHSTQFPSGLCYSSAYQLTAFPLRW